MSKMTTVNFSRERIFCGIDVHEKSWRVNIRSEEFKLEDDGQEADEEALLSHLCNRYLGGTFNGSYLFLSSACL